MTPRKTMIAVALSASSLRLFGGSADTGEVAAKLIALKSSVLKADEADAAKNMLQADIHARMRAASERDTAVFDRIQTRADWEEYRDERLDAMRKSIGSGDMPAKPVSGAVSGADFEVTGTVEGDGFRIENLVIAGRAGLPITANLYLPAKPADSMPGILFVTAHHNGKWQGELLDLSMTWARSGCVVLVVDALGYGERSQQFFGGREDYRWRYHESMQLYTVGRDLMAWMVADLRRGLDVLTARPGVDPRRIIVVGSVAGGGDQAALLAATDNRVSCAIPYNFGFAGVHKPDAPGEQEWVNFVGGGDMDATRCLRNKGRDGFNNWMIVAAIAPRYTINAHEFDWKPDGDIGFARIARVFELYGARDHLETVQGGTDCNNVDPVHRRKFDPILARWMTLKLAGEYQKRVPTDQLICLTPAARTRWLVRPLHAILADAAAHQIASARAALAALPEEKRRAKLRRDWTEKLGNVTPAAAPTVQHGEVVASGLFAAERVLLSVEPGIIVPTLLLKPKAGADKADAKMPVVIAVAQEGKDVFLAKRAREVAQLLARNVAVCVAEVRGTGETIPPGDRFWYSGAVERAAEDLALGQTILGSRVRDLRSVLQYLRGRRDLDNRRVAVWGDSFAQVNSPMFVDPPMKTEVSALQAEPMGATTALLLALYEDDIKAVVARGGLTGFAALLDGPACHVVLDAIVPNVLEAGDLADVAATLSPMPLRIEAAVDGRNRLAGQDRLDRDFALVREAYRAHPEALTLSPAAADDVAAWLGKALQQ